MLEAILYFLIIANAVSFLWLILTGHRPDGERTLAGIAHLSGIIASSALITFLWRGNPTLTILLTLGFGLLAVLLRVLLPTWNTRGHAFLAAFAAVQVIFLSRIAWAIITGGLSPLAILVSLSLFAAETIAVVLTIYFAYEVLDVTCRIRWQRYSPPYTGQNDYWPKVSIHVPAHAEPPDMVIKTLRALRDLDYPTYEVIMVDDNTDDDELWRPV
ncbi:MAG: glycosyltransferase, partial [Anaerolineales bacterium]